MHHSYRQSFNIQTGRRCKIILANEKLSSRGRPPLMTNFVMIAYFAVQTWNPALLERWFLVDTYRLFNVSVVSDRPCFVLCGGVVWGEGGE